MSAGDKFEYHWMDGVKYKKATKLSAPEYVSCLMDWIAVLINNEELFPSDPCMLLQEVANPVVAKFPKTFVQTVKNIFKRLFRVYAHMYYTHYDETKELGIDRHLNTTFKHFMLFVLEHDLVDKKELVPLKTTIQSLTGAVV